MSSTPNPNIQYRQKAPQTPSRQVNNAATRRLATPARRSRVASPELDDDEIEEEEENGYPKVPRCLKCFKRCLINPFTKCVRREGCKNCATCGEGRAPCRKIPNSLAGQCREWEILVDIWANWLRDHLEVMGSRAIAVERVRMHYTEVLREEWVAEQVGEVSGADFPVPALSKKELQDLEDEVDELGSFFWADWRSKNNFNRSDRRFDDQFKNSGYDGAPQEFIDMYTTGITLFAAISEADKGAKVAGGSSFESSMVLLGRELVTELRLFRVLLTAAYNLDEVDVGSGGIPAEIMRNFDTAK